MAAVPVPGQHALAHSSTAVASLSVSFPGTVTAGNSVHVSPNTFQHAIGATEVTDNQGNGTYAQDAVAAGTNSTSSALHSKQNVLSSGTFTITETYGASVVGDLFILEASGVATSSALDKHNSSTPAPAGSGPSTWSGPASGGQSQAGDLVLAATNPVGGAVNSGVTVNTTGYTVVDSVEDGTQYTVSCWAYLSLVGTQTAQCNWTGAETASAYSAATPCVIATYKAAVTNPPPAVLPPQPRFVEARKNH